MMNLIPRCKLCGQIIVVVIATLIFSLVAHCQNDSYIRRAIPSLATSFVSGASEGLNQTLLWHYDSFQARFPNADPQYWNPRVSWTNKYKSGNPALGYAYPGATTFLAWTTDGYHMTRTVSRWTMIGSFTFNGMRARNWKELVLGTALHAVVWSAGFHIMYSGMLKQQK